MTQKTINKGFPGKESMGDECQVPVYDIVMMKAHCGKNTYLYLLVSTDTKVGPMATCPALTRHTSRTPHVPT